MVAAVFANRLRGQAPAAKIADFLPRFEPPWLQEEEPTAEARVRGMPLLLAKVIAVNAALGGRDLRSKRG